ncbi:ATP-binding protein [Blastococcus sp. TF02A-26]|nr:ATP-binding protein [Blastococcus sp. TF02A-26]
MLGKGTDRNEFMRTDTWPRRPAPSAALTPFHHQIDRPAQLYELRAALRGWLPEDLVPGQPDGAVVDTLVLVVDELASNGLRHGGPPVSVTVAPTACGLFLDIVDDDPIHGPAPVTDRDPALGGMGLSMVAQVTTTRGWTTAGDRKHVWACLPLEPAVADSVARRSA